MGREQVGQRRYFERCQWLTRQLAQQVDFPAEFVMQLTHESWGNDNVWFRFVVGFGAGGRGTERLPGVMQTPNAAAGWCALPCHPRH